MKVDMSRHSPSLFLLFASFLRMGVTAFGGPAMIAYIRKRVVGEKKWLDAESFQDGVALCQAIPGATVMQMAAYIGLKLRGVGGAIFSFVGFGLPAFPLMSALSVAYSRTQSVPAVTSIFSGLQAVIVAVMANATVAFGRTSIAHWRDGVIAGVAAGLFGFAANPIVIVVLSALLGMFLNSGPDAARNAAHKSPIKPITLPLLILCLVFASSFFLLFVFRKELFQLALLMSKVDLLAFGGAFGSVPLMFHEIVEARG
jgi:chromate transporter